MPIGNPESDSLRNVIHLTESAACELLLALGAVHWAPARLAAWVEGARAALGADLVADIAYFYGQLWHPLLLMELPVDYTGPADDVQGFIQYVADLDPDSFLFYLWNRIIPREEVPALRADPERVKDRIEAFYEAESPGSGAHKTRGDQLVTVARAPEATQQRLVALLQEFHARVFAAELPQLRPVWAASVREQRDALERLAPEEFVARLLGGRHLPEMYPPSTPLRAVRVVPSYFIWRSNFEVWGYGTIYIFYNATRTARREQERAAEGDRLIETASALADANRLKILAAIAQDPDCNGHKLARLVGISQPAVSRHMAILRRAGLVEEVPGAGRIAYRLCRPAVEEFTPQLLRFLDE
jgi:DNA-binding transcriptional ArsR family regulator